MALRFDSVTADVFRLERTEDGLQLAIGDDAVPLPPGKLNVLAEFLTEAGRIMEDTALPDKRGPGRPAGKRVKTEAQADDQGEPEDTASKTSMVWFQIECRCGEEYLQKKIERVNWAACKNCQSKVYTDRSIGQKASEKGDVWLMTNRYYVPPERQNLTGPYTVAELIGDNGGLTSAASGKETEG